MKHLSHQHFQKNIFTPKRLVFQGVDKAPPSPEHFTGPEQQSDAAARNEVASQSPSQIFNDTISAGGSMQGQYTQGTTTLANLVTNDPIFTGNWSAATTTTTTPSTNVPPQKAA